MCDERADSERCIASIDEFISSIIAAGIVDIVAVDSDVPILPAVIQVQ